jgi:hypothetical protein
MLSSHGWVSRYEKVGLKTFDDELQLFDLMDLDAAGEDDLEEAEVGVDDSTESTLLGMLAQTR